MIINITPTRKVLFEKYNTNHVIDDVLFSSLDACLLKQTNKDAFDAESIFFVKNDKILFEIYPHYKIFWIANYIWVPILLSSTNDGLNDIYPIKQKKEFENYFSNHSASYVLSFLPKQMCDNLDLINFKIQDCAIFKEHGFYEKNLLDKGREYKI